MAFAVLIFSVLTVTHAQLATAPWPMFHHDATHSGLSQYDTSGNFGGEKWHFTTGGAVYSSPAIGADGTVYIGSDDGNLYAINPDGTKKWIFATSGSEGSSPAVGTDGTIYIRTGSDILYAINPDGTKKWQFATGISTASFPVMSSPAIGTDGTIYVGADDGKLYAVNPGGTQKWAFTTSFGIHSSPVVGADGTIYVGSDDENLYAINPDGSQKWAFWTGDNVWASPAIGADGTIYVCSVDGNLHAVTDGGEGSVTQRWAFPTGGVDYESSPAIGVDGTIYIGSGSDKLYAINSDGTQRWAFAAGGAVWLSSPAIGADGTIFVGSDDFDLYAINPYGAKKWMFVTSDRVWSSPAIGSDGTIYVGSSDTNLYALNSASLPTPTATVSPAPTISPTPTIIATMTVTPSPTATLSPTKTLSPTPTVTPTPTATVSQTATISPTLSMTSTSTQTVSPTATISPTATFSPTATSTVTNTATATPTCGGTTSVSPGTVYFSGAPPQSQNVKVTNTGAVNVTMGSSYVSTGSPFELSDLCSGIVLSAGQSCLIGVDYAGIYAGYPNPSTWELYVQDSECDSPPDHLVTLDINLATPVPTSTTTATPVRTATATVTSTPSATPTGPTLTATASPTATVSTTRTAIVTQTATLSPTVTETATATGTVAPSTTLSPTATISPTSTISPTATVSPSPTATASQTATGSPTATGTFTATVTTSTSLTATPSSTITVTRTATVSVTSTPTATATATQSATTTSTRTVTPSGTATLTATRTATATTTPTPTGGCTATCAQISVTPTFYRFPFVGTGTAVRVTNTGSTNACMYGTQLTGSSCFSIDADNCSGKTIAPGANCDIGVNLAGSIFCIMTESATLSINDNGCDSPQKANFQFTPFNPFTPTSTPTPGVSITSVKVVQQGGTTTSLIYPPTAVGDTASKTLEVINTGSVNGMWVTGVNIGDAAEYAVTNNTCPTGPPGVAPGGNCLITIGFTPNHVANPIVSSIQITDNSPTAITNTSAGGTGVADLTLAPSIGLTYGQILWGTSSTLNVTVQNFTVNPVTLTGGDTFTGSNPADFSVGAPTSGTPCGASIPAGTGSSPAKCNIGITFTPGALGAESATLNVAGNPRVPSGEATLGLSTGPTIPATVSPALVLGFPSVKVGNNVTENVTINNLSNVPIAIGPNSISNSGGGSYTLNGGTCGSVLPGGSSCTVGIEFAPAAPGSPINGAVSIGDSPDPKSPRSITLSGNGLP
ncbi:MAG TPA: PQQ-binding-like beta-propeller repeat protein [Candidatus Binataceae bacterium]|nr:PQQ-binding-like beta-propeller repeat protein [Candidatus Binataceae bacterium]